MGDNLKPPVFFYDSLDRANEDTPKPEEKEQRESYTVVYILLTCFIALFILLLFAFAILKLSAIAETQSLGAYAAQLLLWALYAMPIIASGFGAYYLIVWLRHRAYQARMLTMKDGPHYDLFGAKNANYAEMFSVIISRAFDVAEERARQSTYQGVQTLTTDASWSYSPNLSKQETSTSIASTPEQAETITVLPPKVPLLADSRPKMLAMKEKGLICRSGKSLTVGFDDQDRPICIELDKSGAFAVAGRPRKGKTSTVRFLAGQAAMMGGKLVIIDPHGNANEDSLLQSMQPLASSFMIPAAIKPKEALDALRCVFDIGRERVEEEIIHEEDYFPILILIDEFTGMMDGSNPAWAGVAKEISKLLGAVSRQFCKVRINMIVIGHSWKANLAGGSDFRSALGPKIIHQTSAIEAALFEVPRDIARGFNSLQVGQAVKWDNGEAEHIASIPYISAQDLAAIAPPQSQKSTSLHPTQPATLLDSLLEEDIL